MNHRLMNHRHRTSQILRPHVEDRDIITIMVGVDIVIIIDTNKRIESWMLNVRMCQSLMHMNDHPRERARRHARKLTVRCYSPFFLFCIQILSSFRYTFKSPRQLFTFLAWVIHLTDISSINFREQRYRLFWSGGVAIRKTVAHWTDYYIESYVQCEIKAILGIL